jgi:hypothetical protein
MNLAAHKLELSPGVVFLRSIPANWMVCVACFLNLAAEDVGSKVRNKSSPSPLPLPLPLFHNVSLKRISYINLLAVIDSHPLPILYTLSLGEYI